VGDQLLIGIVSGIAVITILGIVNIIKNKADTRKIMTFLTHSLETTGHTFRSNHVIASETNLSEKRVRTLCSNSKKIKRNTKEKESWQITDSNKT
jgi:hypothetical protein